MSKILNLQLSMVIKQSEKMDCLKEKIYCNAHNIQTRRIAENEASLGTKQSGNRDNYRLESPFLRRRFVAWVRNIIYHRSQRPC